jgi:hypothetical protein
MMKRPTHPSRAFKRLVALLGPVLIVATLAGNGTAFASTSAAPSSTPPTAQTKADWQRAIAHVASSGRGCFRASYPALAWRSVRCTVAPKWPLVPVSGLRSSSPQTPMNVGNGNDYTTQVAGTIAGATGYFNHVSPGITETGQLNGSGPQVPNTFSLQLNTQFFATPPACAGASDPSNCAGWQQFVYDSPANDVYMEYWLLNYDTTCPSGWATFHSDCFINSASVKASGASLTAAELSTAQLSAGASQGGNDDVILTTGSGQAAELTNSDSVLDLAPRWNTTEWGVFGRNDGSEANFGSNTTLEAQTALQSDSTSATCAPGGFTGETTNLSLTGTPAIGPGPGLTMGSLQTNGSPSTATCAESPLPNTTPVIAYGSGFATAQSEPQGDIALFTDAQPGSAWSKYLITPTSGGSLLNPDLATNGKRLALVAEDANGNIDSFLGTPASGFTEQSLGSGHGPGFLSIGYSALGGNYVVTTTDGAGDVYYWYSTTKTGGWQSQEVASVQNSGVGFDDSAAVVSDSGVVIAAAGTDSSGDAVVDLYYQPYAHSGWTVNGSYDFGQGSNIYGMDGVWTGSQVDVSVAVDNTNGPVEGGNNDLWVLNGIGDTGTSGSSTEIGLQSAPWYPPTIVWSGFNVGVVSVDGFGDLDFFYSSDNTATSFTEETVASSTDSLEYGFAPGIAIGDSTVAIVNVGSTAAKSKLYGWSQTIGASGWTRQKIGS